MPAAVPTAAADHVSPRKGATGMTGPGLALIIIPIVATASLVVWLIMVFSADGHPRQADRNPAGRHASVPGETEGRQPTATATARLAALGPAGRSCPAVGRPKPTADVGAAR